MDFTTNPWNAAPKRGRRRWRYLLVGLGGAVVGAIATVGALLALTTEQNDTRALCQDALERRRQAEVAIVRSPVFSGDSGAAAIQRLEHTRAVERAQGQLVVANRDAAQYCRQ